MSFYDRFCQWVGIPPECHWYQDFRRGIAVVRIRLSEIPGVVLQKMEMIDCEWRLAVLSRKLFNTYALLGRQVIDHVARNIPISEEEIARVSQQIEHLLEEQQQIEAEQDLLRAAPSKKD